MSTRNKVLEEVKSLIATVSGKPSEEVTEDKKLTDDLNIGSIRREALAQNYTEIAERIKKIL